MEVRNKATYKREGFDLPYGAFGMDLLSGMPITSQDQLDHKMEERSYVRTDKEGNLITNNKALLSQGYKPKPYATKTDMMPKYWLTHEAYFMVERRGWIFGSERVRRQDQTLTKGIPTEATLDLDDEFVKVILTDDFEPVPFDWLLEDTADRAANE